MNGLYPTSVLQTVITHPCISKALDSTTWSSPDLMPVHFPSSLPCKNVGSKYQSAFYCCRLYRIPVGHFGLCEHLRIHARTAAGALLSQRRSQRSAGHHLPRLALHRAGDCDTLGGLHVWRAACVAAGFRGNGLVIGSFGGNF